MAIIEIELEVEHTWLHQDDLIDSDWHIIYMRSFYWSLATMMLIGSQGVNFIEELVGAIIVLLTVGVFAFTINEIGNILNEINKETQEYNQELTNINKYMIKKKISRQLQEKVRSHIEYYYTESQQVGQGNDTIYGTIQKLPSNLKEEMTQEINTEIMDKFPIFQELFTNRTLHKLTMSMQENICMTNEIIYTEGQEENLSIFLILKGEVDILTIKKQEQNEGMPEKLIETRIKRCQPGQIIGTFGLQYKFTARCNEKCVLYQLKKKDFELIIRESDEDFENYKVLKDRLMNKYFIQKTINFECYICGRGTHTEQKCNYVHYQPRDLDIIKQVKGKKHFSRKPFNRKYVCMVAEKITSNNLQEQDQGPSENKVNALKEFLNLQVFYTYLLDDIQNHADYEEEFRYWNEICEYLDFENNLQDITPENLQLQEQQLYDYMYQRQSFANIDHQDVQDLKKNQKSNFGIQQSQQELLNQVNIIQNQQQNNQNMCSIQDYTQTITPDLESNQKRQKNTKISTLIQQKNQKLNQIQKQILQQQNSNNNMANSNNNIINSISTSALNNNMGNSHQQKEQISTQQQINNESIGEKSEENHSSGSSPKFKNFQKDIYNIYDKSDISSETSSNFQRNYEEKLQKYNNTIILDNQCSMDSIEYNKINPSNGSQEIINFNKNINQLHKYQSQQAPNNMHQIQRNNSYLQQQKHNSNHKIPSLLNHHIAMPRPSVQNLNFANFNEARYSIQSSNNTSSNLQLPIGLMPEQNYENKKASLKNIFQNKNNPNLQRRSQILTFEQRKRHNSILLQAINIKEDQQKVKSILKQKNISQKLKDRNNLIPWKRVQGRKLTGMESNSHSINQLPSIQEMSDRLNEQCNSVSNLENILTQKQLKNNKFQLQLQCGQKELTKKEHLEEQLFIEFDIPFKYKYYHFNCNLQNVVYTYNKYIEKQKENKIKKGKSMIINSKASALNINIMGKFKKNNFSQKTIQQFKK